MTVYARSDVAAVSISTEHGGCGVSHSRPAPGGVPARVWALTCHGGCEDFLRGDPLWASTPQSVPETPDEVSIRTDAERRGQVEQQTSMTQALNDLAKLGNLPEVLAQLLGNAAQGGKAEAITIEQELRLCRNGHANSRTVKFCGECGADMEDAANKQPVAALSGPESAGSGADDLDLNNLEGMTLKELQAIAQRVGADVVRSKAEQATLIRQKMTNSPR